MNYDFEYSRYAEAPYEVLKEHALYMNSIQKI